MVVMIKTLTPNPKSKAYAPQSDLLALRVQVFNNKMLAQHLYNTAIVLLPKTEVPNYWVESRGLT